MEMVHSMNPRHDEMEESLLKHNGMVFSYNDSDPEAELYREMEGEGLIKSSAALAGQHHVTFTDYGRKVLAMLKEK